MAVTWTEGIENCSDWGPGGDVLLAFDLVPDNWSLPRFLITLEL